MLKKNNFSGAILIFFGLSFYFFVVQEIQASPSILSCTPDPITHKEVVEITGSGFGVKSPAAPLRYDDFQNGVEGNRAPSEALGGWYTETGVVYDDTYQRFENDMCLQQNFNTNGSGYNQTIGLTSGGALQETGKLYMHAWWRIETWNHATRNCKILNIGVDIGSGDWNSRMDLHPASGDGLMNILAGCPGSVQVVDYVDWQKVLGDDGNWHRVDSWFDGNTGYRNYYVDNEVISIVAHDPPRSVFTDCVNPYIGYAYFGHYYTDDTYDPDPMAQRWYGELYVDNTRARIELGNSPNFETCTHREIQIPVAWSDNSITFTVNQGSFSNGDTAYLFSIDENGYTSDGFPVTIGIKEENHHKPDVPVGLRVE